MLSLKADKAGATGVASTSTQGRAVTRAAGRRYRAGLLLRGRLRVLREPAPAGVVKPREGIRERVGTAEADGSCERVGRASA